MTDTALSRAEAPGAAPAHPLDPATGAEYLAGREILAAAGLLGDTVRFAYYGLEEPPKDEVLAGPPDGRPRRLRAFLIDVATGASADVVVSLDENRVVSHRVLDPPSDGQVPIISEDFAVVEEVVRADPGWRAAMARRGLTDVTKIRACPQTAGKFDEGDDERRRFVRVLAFRQQREHDYVWAHPVDGITAYVDLIERKVFKIIDEFERPVPDESGDYDDPAVRGPLREGLRPIEITQPEGPSFTLDGHLLRWQGWSLRVGFDAREGLTLHQISLDDDGETRPLVYRASIPELVVPYGDPRFRYWQTYFDCGEFLLGKWTNSLERGCDCLGEIAYLDATVADDFGAPRVIRNAVCIHEEDFGILWKHTDIFNGSAQTRRQRRLVVSSWATVGNYDYGFYWYFYLDGTIEHEVKMTGALFTAAYPGGDHPHSTEVAPGLGGPVHQHLFSARLDMTVDGLANAVEEVDVSGMPIGPDNPYGNAHRQDRDPAAQRGSGGPPGRRYAGPNLAGGQHRAGQPVRPADGLHAVPGLGAGAAGRSFVVRARAGQLRRQPPVGDPVRPGAAVPGGRLRQPEPGRRWPAGVHRGRPRHRRRGHRGVAHVRAHPLPAP